MPYITSDEEIILFNRGSKAVKHKESKFDGWCAKCSTMMMKSDKKVCPSCGCKGTTKVRPEMKEPGEQRTGWLM